MLGIQSAVLEILGPRFRGDERKVIASSAHSRARAFAACPPLHRTDVGENNPTFMASRPCKAGQPPRFRPVAIPPSRGSSKETAVDKAYLEDLAPGQVFTSDARTVVDADAIKRFGGEFDPQPWHLNEAVAHSTFFKELVASGWHTTALTMQLIIQTLPLSGGIIGSGVDELRWPRPVRPGDTLRLHCEIIDVQESKLRPASGTVRVRMTTLNQNDQPVQTMIANLLAFRRPEQAA
jgi:acyl dehydratase